MTDLFLIITSIGLLDSLSMMPLCIVLMPVLLAGERALLASAAFLLAIAAVYLIFGLLVLLGLDAVFDQLDEFAIRVWRHPDTIELALQLLLGIGLCAFGLQIQRARNRRGEQATAVSMTSLRAALAGAGLAIVGLPGAIPYLAAIELVRRAELVFWKELLALVYYNLIFVAPIAAIMAIGALFGERGRRFLGAVQRFLERWGHRLVAVLLIALGAILAADAIGWFLGYPLIPVA